MHLEDHRAGIGAVHLAPKVVRELHTTSVDLNIATISVIRPTRALARTPFAVEPRVRRPTLILEAQNLTAERNTLFIDSEHEDTLFETEIGSTYTFGAT
jgi:hypothetical protein